MYKVQGRVNLGSAYSKELCNTGVQAMPEEGIRSSPKKRKPPPFPLKQWPKTLRVKPSSCSCEMMLDLPPERPRTPSV